MNNIGKTSIVFMLFLQTGVFAQDLIPAAEPAEDLDAALQANPGRDQLRIADMLFLQAQDAKGNPAEYRRLMASTAQRYSDFVKANPNSPEVPLALYRTASCMMEAGQSNEAYQIFASLVQQYKGDVAAGAAYRLATEAYKKSDWKNAERFYQTAVQESTKDELRHDARYRLARVYSAQKQTEKSIEQFRALASDKTVEPEIAGASKQALVTALADTGKREEAYIISKEILKDDKLENSTRGSILLQAAALASLLNKDDEAQDFYSQIIDNPALIGKSAEAQLGMMMKLSNKGKHKEVLKLYDQGQIQTDDKVLDGKRRWLAGRASYETKDYTRAANLFTIAEKSNPHTEFAMEAAYGRLLAYQKLEDPSLAVKAQQFLNNYAKAFPVSPLPHMVRFIAAESLSKSNPAQAVAFYEAINMDRIDKSLHSEVTYREAWACSKAGNREKAIVLLDKFINDYPRDTRMPVAIALRGDMNLATGREALALQDFEKVIKEWPKHEAAASAWQKSAQIYESKQDVLNMIKSYEGLIKNFPKTIPAVLADARFKIGLGYLERKDYNNAIPNFEEARTLNPERYAEVVDRRLIQTYYQLEDAVKLKGILEAMREKDPKSLEGVPDPITAWLGLHAFGTGDYIIADRYLTLATRNNELNRVKRIIWKNLAIARLSLKRYPTALVAADFYLEEEKTPYGKAEGYLYKSQILLGLGKYKDARKAVEEALALGIEGPLKASLKIALGDIAYAEKKYDEAAKNYATTAELFVSDQQLKPEALYKAHGALLKAGRAADAAEYKAMLNKEFPGWSPKESQELPPSEG